MNEKFYFKGNEQLPTILFDKESGLFSITGRSIPEDGKVFYEPALKWLEIYSLNPLPNTHLIFDIEYFNISSSKMILYILYKLCEIQSAGYTVRVTWCYTDEYDEMFEVGEDYAFMVNIPFEFKAVKRNIAASKE
jgi:hypothetical protein